MSLHLGKGLMLRNKNRLCQEQHVALLESMSSAGVRELWELPQHGRLAKCLIISTLALVLILAVYDLLIQRVNAMR